MVAHHGKRVDITDKHEDPFQSLNSARKVLGNNFKLVAERDRVTKLIGCSEK